jgi:hypothetical protein
MHDESSAEKENGEVTEQTQGHLPSCHVHRKMLRAIYDTEWETIPEHLVALLRNREIIRPEDREWLVENDHGRKYREQHIWEKSFHVALFHLFPLGKNRIHSSRLLLPPVQQACVTLLVLARHLL